MARKLFHGTIAARLEWDARHHDGRKAFQVTGAVWASSKKKAAAIFGMSLYEFNNYASEGWPDAEAALADVPDGVLMVKPCLHGTIRGQTGWTRAHAE